MTLRKLLWSLLAIIVMWSCGKDDDTPPPPPTNTAPVIAAQSFTVVESISDAAAIGTVKATDADDDALTFSIKTNSDNLFEITGAGVLSLASGKALSFATKASHSLTVSVTDGTDTASAAVTVNVTEATGEEPTNEAPTAEEQSFEVAEDAAAGDVVGTAAASDEDEDALTFALVTDESELFVVADNGEITLAEGKSLDFETTAEYGLTLSVSDGTNVPVEFMVTVTVTDVNEAPTAADQSIEVAEDQTVVGTVEGSDPEGNTLTFALVTDESELFQVAENGEISLAEGKNLDFETTTEHTLTLSVSDGTNDPVEFTVTVTVTNVIESLFEDPASFILKFDVAAGQELEIGLNAQFEYDYTIDWGDGTEENYTTNENPTHTYDNANTYTVAIKGTFPAIVMLNSLSGGQSLVDVVQWGTQQWQDMKYAFAFCSNLEGFSATDQPDLSNVTDMSFMFQNSTNFNGTIGNWDTSNVTDMSAMFFGATAFNQPLVQSEGGWNTSNVINMARMFQGASAFNQAIGSWDTSNVTDMSGMFRDAVAFNQSLSNWQTMGVSNMSRMFQGASSFNQSLGWCMYYTNNLSYMFQDAASFDQDLTIVDEKWCGAPKWFPGGENPGSSKNWTGMFNGDCGMSPQNINAVLNRFTELWPEGIAVSNQFGLGNLTYCGPDALADYNFLVGKGMNITGGVYEDVCP